MNKHLRTPLIAGNWKMNNTVEEATSLVESLLPLVATASCDIAICPPFTALFSVNQLLVQSNVKLGAQNCHFEKNGAYTGEISADMLLDVGCSYVILGHSERRSYFGETDESVNKRLHTALQSGLTAILCVGESLAQREKGITEPFIKSQIENALAGIPASLLQNLVVAYEPIWAIGTGLTATPLQAGEVCGFIRTLLAAAYGEDFAQRTRILYGGSMNAKNAAELLAMPDIDGGLIGGAALKAADFSAIVNAASQGEAL